jgi:hypothetical protein
MEILKVIWQLPQYLLSLILHKVWKTNIYSMVNGRVGFRKVYWIRPLYGISCGVCIFLTTYTDTNSVKHEYGHCVQSLYLGPLYLLVVGIPSFTMNILSRMGILKNENYYKRWPESWADNLGGVVRN